MERPWVRFREGSTGKAIQKLKERHKYPALIVIDLATIKAGYLCSKAGLEGGDSLLGVLADLAAGVKRSSLL